MKKEITMEEFVDLLPQICHKDTSADPKRWVPENPLEGHCLVVSLAAQSHFGGDILSASLYHVPEFSYMNRHFVNKLPDGTIKDFTEQQFGKRYPEGLGFKSKDRKDILYNKETGKPRQIMKRYGKFAYRLAKAVSEDNPLFSDPVYESCFYAALESPCQKMKFGCAVIYDSEIVYNGCNDQAIKELKHMCEPTCVRLSIQSRTEQMLGACSHAEELAISDIIKKKIPFEECDIYIAGFYPNGLPWIKQAAEHTCLRCSTQMYNAGFRKIYVPVIDKWEGITPQEAVKGAVAYATGKKTV